MYLTTSYMGMKLKNPLVPGACGPLSRDLAKIRAMEDAGAAAVVMYSLFEEEIQHEAQELDHYLTFGAESFAEALSYFPGSFEFKDPDLYLEHLSEAKQAVDIPVIGSLNGISTGGWIEWAKKIEQTGADALELNIYYIPTNPELTGMEVEQLYLDVLKEVKQNVKIPVAIKLGPYFSSMANMANRLCKAGADGMVLFNRFYQPDIDTEQLEVVPNLLLSTQQEMRLPMRWIAILYGQIPASLAATTGVHTAEDVIKMIMAGADVTMLCSALLKHGLGRISEIIKGMIQWMEIHEYESVDQMKGSMSHKACAQPAAFERANYMRALKSYV